MTFILTFPHDSLAVDNTNQKEEYKIIDRLVVNNKNNYKTAIYKNEDEGVSEMRGLVENSQTEESWAYLPLMEKWIEIGYNEEPEKKVKQSYITKTKLDVQLLDVLMDENDNMILYHFHPPSYHSLDDEIAKRERQGLPMSDKEIEKERTGLLIKSSYPSRSDLMNMIGNSTEFYDRNPDGEITFKICSHFGITEYCLTGEGLIHLYANNTPEQILKIKAISLSANVEVNVTGEILQLNPRRTRNPLKRNKMNPKQKRESLSRYTIIKPLSRIERALESMNDEYMRVTFTPYH
ncbi:MAG: hypothetical protein GY777_32775 [Candidatus Brocadiaceae bacterium]|nr:hypothetical protein [Candidatus Brocadiaceae bacterium]